ncbi:MAG: methyltransferase [Gemmatimonas sp. SG8_28]|nr:MAG: methyltransferase [Gemmatimonas sp. SG8_28]
MDIWKFYAVTHGEHAICNPTSREKLERLVALLRLPAGSAAVDIASGKGELLIRLAETYGISGLGIDISPYFVRDARARLEARVPRSAVVFREMDGATFVPDEPGSFAFASCLGASWVFGGHGGTLDALAGFVAPGGWVVVGEPFWLREPAQEYLGEVGLARTSFGTHAENVAAGEQRGLELAYTLVSNTDDWDQYEGLQWYAALTYARSHPADPDVPEIAQRIAKERRAYLQWGRETLGWAMYAFRQPISAPDTPAA